MKWLPCVACLMGVAFAATPPPIAAQSAAASRPAEPPSHEYGLSELVGLAIQHTQLLGSQDARIEENRLSAVQARVWPGSSLEFSIGRKREADVSGPRYEAALSQPLPVLGRPGLLGGLLDLESEGWRVQRVASQLAVTLNVVKSAYEYAVNRRKAEFLEQRQKRFELVGSYMAGREFPTPQRKAESRIVENRLKTSSADVILSQAGYKASLEKLRVYVPLDPGNYPDIEVPWFSGTRSLDGQDWLAKTLESNPDLRAQRLVVERAKLERKLAAREGLPDPSIVASYEEGRAAETEKNVGLGLSLALPAWNRNRAGIRSAEQRRLAEERLLSFQEQQLKGELPRAVLEYEAARQIVLKYPQAVLPGLETELREAEAGFRKGQVDLLTFLELDSAASETYARVLKAQLTLAEKVAELMAIRGEQDILTQFGSF